ncbi:type 4a pilus biogenesis protein PilO [Candidatus Parcubacteria bacterium]|nr:type 4a pilus biogenesis protein PilO [Candidatus Parcubacteria bacterium]
MNFKNKTQTSLIMFCVLNIGLIAFLIYPLISDIRKNSQELISAKKDFIVFEAKIRNLEEFNTTYLELEPNFEKAFNLFIDPKAPVRFMESLEKISQDCQMQTEILPVQISRVKEDQWSFLPLKITSVGYFPNFLKFLKKIEYSPYLIEIQSLSINGLTEREIKSKEFENLVFGGVRTTLDIKVFTQQEQ